MSTDEIIEEEVNFSEEEEKDSPGRSNYKVPKIADEHTKYHLTGKYQNWFLDYATYVKLERDLPEI